MNDLPWGFIAVMTVALAMFGGVLYQARRWNRRHGRRSFGVADPAAEVLWSRTPRERRRAARRLARHGLPAEDPETAALVCAHSGRMLHNLANPWETLALWLVVLAGIPNGHDVLTGDGPALYTQFAAVALFISITFVVGYPPLRLYLLRRHAHAHELNRPLAEQAVEG